MTDIVFLKPYLVDKIWGGNNLKKFNIKFRSHHVGEAWIVSGFKDRPSTIVSGQHKGMSLYKFYKTHRDFFNNCKCKQYPLLVKILDCNDKLSIQVHPKTGPNKKNEAWFVLETKNKAKIIYGHTAKNRSAFVTCAKNSDWNKLLRVVNVHKHDIINIPSGMLHALGNGLLIYEVQQPSDVTYRLYDYDRGRHMDVNKTINNVIIPNKPLKINDTGCLVTPYFKIKYINNIKCHEYTFKDANWLQITVINGKGLFNKIVIKKGDTFITSHRITSFILRGRIELLISYI